MPTKVEGLDRLKRKLRALPELAQQELRPVMEKAAGEVVSMARSLAPVESGDLRDSIGWTWGAAPEGSMTLGRVGGEGNLRITIYAGDDKAFYARWVEFGTIERPAQPFFFPAYRAVKKRIKGQVSRAISKSAKRAAGA